MSKFQAVCSLVLLFNVQASFCRATGGVHPPRQVIEQNDACTGHALLNTYERGQFLEFSLGKRAQVLAQLVSARGCGQQMLEALRNLGAIVRYSDERSGYALVSISSSKLLNTLDLPGIAYAYVSDDDSMYSQGIVAKIPQSQRRAEPVPQITIPHPHVAKTLPNDGPDFATDEIGLAALWKRHPEADGRGVQIAISDEGFDLLHRALQEAKDVAGRIVPKVADLGTLTSPEEDSGWVQFGEPIRTKDRSFEAAGRTWTVPKDGSCRFGIFKQDL